MSVASATTSCGSASNTATAAPTSDRTRPAARQIEKPITCWRTAKR